MIDLYKRLLSFSKSHAARFILAMFCMLVVGLSTAAAAYLVKPALDEIFLNKNQDTLLWIPIAILVIYLLKGLGSYGQTVLMSYIGHRIVADLRYNLYRHILLQPLAFFTRNPTGTLMSRITYDVNLVRDTVSEAVTSILKDTFTLLALIFVIFYRDWKLAIIAVIVFPIAIYPITLFGRKMRKIARASQVTMGTLTSLLQETISGNRIVKAFGMEEYESKRFSKENERLFRLVMRSVSVRAITSPLMEFLGGVGIAAIVFYGGYQVIQGASTPGTFFSFLAALLMLYEPAKRLTNVNITIQQGLSAAERIFNVMDKMPEIRDKEGAAILPRIAEEIHFNRVSFSYDKTPVLKNIDLIIKAGETVAFAGMSGGGKTTLVNLIPRFYDVTEGRILIDGTDIRDVTVNSLRSQIAIVTQQTILFNDTVRNNIAYGDIRKSDEEIVKAAKAANAHDFILKLPEGYDTVIGEQGVKLSGGERQRISIARALLKDAPILILDEATSSLDSEAEAEVQDAVDRLIKGRTTLMIAHRLSTIRNADRIIVIVDGRIVEEGSHESLLTREGEYWKLYQMQFREAGASGVDTGQQGHSGKPA
ncbi:MAG TPA: lipid A export permease/ATP-binding protein MsbA [Syntrophales bacterium]|mgnify:CR=1 FL=1|jgi:subfamily B ATP-binding cassette protein MsbA|nr:lipid A export permease/ATP-binding protein MsbA [Syntrophales bacterium]